MSGNSSETFYRYFPALSWREVLEYQMQKMQSPSHLAYPAVKLRVGSVICFTLTTRRSVIMYPKPVTSAKQDQIR